MDLDAVIVKLQALKMSYGNMEVVLIDEDESTELPILAVDKDDRRNRVLISGGN